MIADLRPWYAAGCLVFREGTDQVLLLHDPERGWDLPKGKPEPGETPLETALRETYEEAGVYPKVHPYLWVWIPEMYLFCGTSRALPTLLPNPETGQVEHDTAGYFTVSRARAMLMPSLSPSLSVFTLNDVQWDFVPCERSGPRRSLRPEGTEPARWLASP